MKEILKDFCDNEESRQPTLVKMAASDDARRIQNCKCSSSGKLNESHLQLLKNSQGGKEWKPSKSGDHSVRDSERNTDKQNCESLMHTYSKDVSDTNSNLFISDITKPSAAEKVAMETSCQIQSDNKEILSLNQQTEVKPENFTARDTGIKGENTGLITEHPDTECDVRTSEIEPTMRSSGKSVDVAPTTTGHAGKTCDEAVWQDTDVDTSSVIYNVDTKNKNTFNKRGHSGMIQDVPVVGEGNHGRTDVSAVSKVQYIHIYVQ